MSPTTSPNSAQSNPASGGNPRRQRKQPAEPAGVGSRDTSLPTPPADGAPLIDWALYLAEFGRLTGALKVFPCGANKRPLHKRRQNEAGEEGWKEEATNDPAKIKAWQTEASWRTIGMAIQPGFAAIDVDRYKPGATEILGAFEAKHGKFPATFRSLTASGGEHYLFATDKVSGTGTGDLPDFIDVRGYGGYIIGPGSTFEGKRYKLDRLMPPVVMPEYLETLIGETKSRDRSKPDEPAHLVVVDHPRNIQAYADWCAGNPVETLATPHGEVAEPCIEGKRGNNMLAATGAMGHDYGLSAHVALEVAFEHHNPRCEPPWDDEPYETHFLSGYRSATGRLGWRAPCIDTSKLFKPVPLEERGPKPADTPQGNRYLELLRHFDGTLTASGNRDRRAKRFRDVADLPEVPWIIPGWLSQNATWLMYGESESFKTYITINMLLCVAAGRPWARHDGFEGYPVGQARPVVLFAGEGYDDVRKRVKAAIEGGKFDRALVGENLILVPDVYSLNYADGLARMADELEALNVRPAIIAVDTLNLALDGNEDSSDEIKKALRGLRALAVMFDAAGLVIDHVGHGDKTRPRGSSAKKANADGMILCERDGDNKRVALTQTKNRADDKTKYRAAFEGSLVNLSGSKPNLSFQAVEPATPDNKISAKARAAEQEIISLEIVSKAVRKFLGANPAKAWSERKLAKAVAADETIEVGEESLRKDWLPKLRGSKSDPGRHCYDRMTERWRHHA